MLMGRQTPPLPLPLKPVNEMFSYISIYIYHYINRESGSACIRVCMLQKRRELARMCVCEGEITVLDRGMSSIIPPLTLLPFSSSGAGSCWHQKKTFWLRGAPPEKWPSPWSKWKGSGLKMGQGRFSPIRWTVRKWRTVKRSVVWPTCDILESSSGELICHSCALVSWITLTHVTGNKEVKGLNYDNKFFSFTKFYLLSQQLSEGFYSRKQLLM